MLTGWIYAYCNKYACKTKKSNKINRFDKKYLKN